MGNDQISWFFLISFAVVTNCQALIYLHTNKSKIDYLGFQISDSGIRPGTKKVEVIEDFSEPKDIHSLRRLLGISNLNI